MEMLQRVWKQHLRPRAVVGYGVKIFLPSPPNYVTRSPGCDAFTIDIFFCFLSLFLESETWNSYVLTHVKDTITEPLTTLPSKELEKEALKLFKVCYNLKFP